MTMPTVPLTAPSAAPTTTKPAAQESDPTPPEVGSLVAYTHHDPYDPSASGGASRTVYGFVVGVDSQTNEETGVTAHRVAVAIIDDLRHGIPSSELTAVDSVHDPVAPAPPPAA